MVAGGSAIQRLLLRWFYHWVLSATCCGIPLALSKVILIVNYEYPLLSKSSCSLKNCFIYTLVKNKFSQFSNTVKRGYFWCRREVDRSEAGDTTCFYLFPVYKDLSIFFHLGYCKGHIVVYTDICCLLVDRVLRYDSLWIYRFV